MRALVFSSVCLLVAGGFLSACGGGDSSGDGDGDGDSGDGDASGGFTGGDGDGDGDGDASGGSVGDGDGDVGLGGAGTGGQDNAPATITVTMTSALADSVSFELNIDGADAASCALEDAPCEVTASAQTITLSPTSLPGYARVAFTGCDSVEDNECTADVVGDSTITAHLEQRANLVFITNAKFDGNLGGHTGAAAKCQAAADAEELPGTYVALLHDGSTGPDLATEDGPEAQGFLTVGGKYVAHSADQILRGDFSRLIPNEQGESVGHRPTWLNLDDDGTSMGAEHCEGYSTNSDTVDGDIFYASTIGRDVATQLGCEQALGSILCVGVDGVYDVDAPGVDKTNDSVFFVTKNSWSPNSSGRAAADLACKGEAEAAGLSGTYQAYLSVSGELAGERIDSSRTYVRGDGTPFLSTSDLEAGNTFVGQDLPMNVHADGTTTLEHRYAWTGDTESSNCSSFMTNASGSSQVGRINYPYYWFDDIGSRACNLTSYLYCFRAY